MNIIKIIALCLISSFASAEITVVPKFIYVLHGGVDAIWGQYMFVVRNDGTENQSAQIKVAIPSETVDWKGQEGLDGIQFSLGKKGGLVFTKEFKPSDNIHTVGFKAPASAGVSELTLNFPLDIAELSFMTSGDLKVSGTNLKEIEKAEGERYNKYLAYDIKKGESFSVKVSGVHVGRSEFWIYGWAVALILLFGCFGIAYRTRPKSKQEVI